MENSSKALIIVASVLISIMIISFMVYLFSRTSSFSSKTEEKINDEINAFNAQFVRYDTGDDWSNTIGSDDAIQLRAVEELKNIYDILTVVNLAYEINDRNNNNYKYGVANLETVNSLEIIIEGLNNLKGKNLKRFYLLEPNKMIEPHCVYGVDNVAGKIKNINSFNPTNNKLNLYTIMTDLREMKKQELNNEIYTVYKYYFSGKCHYNTDINKIDSIRFKLIINNGF